MSLGYFFFRLNGLLSWMIRKRFGLNCSEVYPYSMMLLDETLSEIRVNAKANKEKFLKFSGSLHVLTQFHWSPAQLYCKLVKDQVVISPILSPFSIWAFSYFGLVFFYEVLIIRLHHCLEKDEVLKFLLLTLQYRCHRFNRHRHHHRYRFQCLSHHFLPDHWRVEASILEAFCWFSSFFQFLILNPLKIISTTLKISAFQLTVLASWLQFLQQLFVPCCWLYWLFL